MLYWEPNHDAFQIPGTDLQQDSPSWFSERQFRITASICKTITRLGMNLDRQACYSWLRKYLWFKDKFTTFYIQYGIGSRTLCYSGVLQICIH